MVAHCIITARGNEHDRTALTFFVVSVQAAIHVVTAVVAAQHRLVVHIEVLHGTTPINEVHIISVGVSAQHHVLGLHIHHDPALGVQHLKRGQLRGTVTYELHTHAGTVVHATTNVRAHTPIHIFPHLRIRVQLKGDAEYGI